MNVEKLLIIFLSIIAFSSFLLFFLAEQNTGVICKSYCEAKYGTEYFRYFLGHCDCEITGRQLEFNLISDGSFYLDAVQ